MANAIKNANLTDSYLDTTRSARYQRIEYDNAFNSAIKNFIDSITGTEDNPISNFQLNQVYQDNLYTLQKVQNAAPVTDTALYPTDYRSLDKIFATIDGIRRYVRPMTQNKQGPMLDDSYRTATDKLPYYLQELTGFKILHGPGTISSVELNYVKAPTTFTVGKDTQLISAGTPITNGSSYIAVDPSVQNGVSYNIGDQFTAVGTTLTSGTVILASNTVTIELPEKTHDQICKMAAEIMSGNTSDFQRSAYAENQASKS